MDYGETVKKIIYPLAILFIFIILERQISFTTLVHEFGHSFVCVLFGGKVSEIRIEKIGGEIICTMPMSTLIRAFVFLHIAGILAELALALTFLSIRYTSHIGGYLFLLIGFKWFYGVYDFDLIIFPFLLTFPVKFSIFILSNIIFPISIYITLKSWIEL